MVCDIMTEDRGSESNVIKLVKVNKLINSGQKKCSNVTYESTIEDLRNVTIDFDGAGELELFREPLSQQTAAKLSRNRTLSDFNDL